MKIYRWHISRKMRHPSMDSEGPQKIDVIITPAKEELVARFQKARPGSPRELPSDNLDWWESDESLQLEGWTTERVLLEALIKRNFFADAIRLEAPDEDRRIVEEMVLLELVWEEAVCEKLWLSLIEQEGWPDVSPLAEIEGSRWLDYTQPSRHLARDLYLRVLGEVEEERGYAAE